MNLNKTFRILVMVFFVYVTLGMSKEALAATVSDSARDDTTGSANVMNMGDTASGSITESDDLDYYRFTLATAGCVKLDMTAYMKYYCIKIYGADGEEIWYTDRNEWTESVGYRRDNYNVYLEAGSYYMQVNGYLWHDSDSNKSTGTYECKTSFFSSGVNNIEADNSFATANTVILNNSIVGQISVNDDFDTFQYTLSTPGCVKLDMTSYMKYYCIKIFDATGEEIWYTDRNEWTESVGYRRDNYNVYLEAGNYYMQVNGYLWHDSDSNKSTGKYVLATQFQSSNVTFDGNDNAFSVANAISWNKNYTGQISINDDFDTYKFQVDSGKTVVINMASYMKYYCIKIFDTKGEEIWYTDRNEWTESVGYRSDSQNVVLSAGTYYMQINGCLWHDSDSNKSTGKYVFSLSELNQKNCNHQYKESTVYPTYFSKGYVKHKCEKCGKVYKDQYTAKKKLGESYISTYSYAGKRKIYLQWMTVSDASGYEVRYCKSKKMKKGVKIIKVKGQKKYKKTIKKLSRKKKYYVQVRAYKQSGSKIVYGKWSSKKGLKTK